jgi:GAF domain-containing protein
MSKRQDLRYSLLSTIDRLPLPKDTVSRPGFIGQVPYLLILRWAFFVGILLRFALFTYTGNPALVYTSIVVTGILVLVNTYLAFRTNHQRSARAQAALIALDLILISLFYYWTGNPQSGLLMFYFIPVLTATECFSFWGMLTVSGVTTCTFSYVILHLFPNNPITQSLWEYALRVFLPRAIFLVAVFALSSWLRQIGSQRKEMTSQRETEMQVLLRFKAEVDQLFDTQQVLDLTLSAACEIAGAAGGCVCLIDHNTNGIIAQAYSPWGYVMVPDSSRPTDPLASQVIQELTARSLMDVRTDPELTSLFDPDVRSAICIPVSSHDTLLGTLSVGRSTRDPFDEHTKSILDGIARQVATAIERIRLLTALNEIGEATTGTRKLDSELDDILHQLTDGLGFEYAMVSLVDEYRQVIESVRGRNVAPGWIRRSRHELKSADIQADIVRTGRTEVFDEWDERFDREIFERFGHVNLARIFSPLVVNGSVVGTLEAGCRRERQAEIITRENIKAVERLGKTRGAAIAEARPYVLLELIARNATRIIGADSASIHVYKSGEPLLVAGTGKADKDFLTEFPPRSTGMGWRSIRQRRVEKIDAPAELRSEHRLLYDRGVRAIAAFPLFLGADVKGVLYVHFWREHRFSQAELELEKVFARQIEVVIQNSLLLQSISEAAQRARALPELQRIVQSLALAPSLNLRQVLEDVAAHMLNILDADSVTLYQYFQAENRFDVPPVMQGDFRDQASMKMQIFADDIVWRIVGEGKSRFISNVRSNKMVSGVRTDGVKRLRFVEREGIVSSAAIVLRAGDTDEIVGLMFINYRMLHDFSPEEQRTIGTLASSAAIAIKTTRLRHDRELEALRAVDQRIVASARAPDIQPILEFILETGVKAVEAPTGAIMWYDWREDILKARATRGFPKGRKTLRLEIGEGIVGHAAEKMESVLAHDVTSQEWAGVYKSVIPGTRSELAVPLVDESGLLGVLNVEHHRVGAFSEDDRALLETLAVQAITAIHSVNLYLQLDRQVKSLHALNVIAARTQNPSYALDTVLHLLLTGVTIGEGLGFSRAMLFLTDDEGATLRGKMAIGAQTEEEAKAAWYTIGEEAASAQARGEDILILLLDHAEAFSVAVLEGKEPDWPLSTRIQDECIPIEEASGALFRCIFEGRTIIVEDADPDPFREIIERATRPGDTGRAFACVPLVAKEGTIGALVVDNRFVESEEEIGRDTVDSLEAFAGMLAMGIENARLRDQLVEEQRMKTWKEFAARTAHIIGTRISVIEGALTQLRWCLLDGGAIRTDQLDEAQLLLSELTEGIHKAKTRLVEFRTFAAPPEFQFSEVDLNEILQGTIREIEHSVICPIELSLLTEPLIVQGDPLRLSDAFIELIGNSNEAMRKDSRRMPRIAVIAGKELLPSDKKAVAKVEFRDTGPGIPDEKKELVFEPFFSTKGRRSGLGLTIVKQIIDRHKGKIEEVGTPGIGACFIIRLPIPGTSENLEKGEK